MRNNTRLLKCISTTQTLVHRGVTFLVPYQHTEVTFFIRVIRPTHKRFIHIMDKLD